MIGFINASPLIYLGKIGLLKYLPQLFSRVITAQEVKNEVLSDNSAPENPVLELAFSKWMEVEEPKDKDLLEKLNGLNIHAGEASIVVLAKEYSETDARDEGILIIDDLAARNIAKTFGLEVTGTIGIMLLITEKNLIEPKDCIENLRYLVEETTFRISTRIYSLLMKHLEGMK
ncbi:MAG: hypothetical protein ACFFCS_12895 [Candidatus Hodarchaeota archaeon]